MAKSFFYFVKNLYLQGLTNSDMTFKNLCLAEQLARNGNRGKGTTDCEQLAFNAKHH